MLVGGAGVCVRVLMLQTDRKIFLLFRSIHTLRGLKTLDFRVLKILKIRRVCFTHRPGLFRVDRSIVGSGWMYTGMRSLPLTKVRFRSEDGCLGKVSGLLEIPPCPPKPFKTPRESVFGKEESGSTEGRTQINEMETYILDVVLRSSSSTHFRKFCCTWNGSRTGSVPS